MTQPEAQFCKLHFLIKSLTKNEKGYLKKYSKIFLGSPNSRLVIYYSILEKMKIYDKEKLETQLKKKGKLSSFKNVKNILFNSILEDLSILKSNNSVSSKYLIEHIKMTFLYQKGMYKESFDHFSILNKVKNKDSSPISSLLYARYKYLYHEQLQSGIINNNNIQEIEQDYDKSIDEIFIESKILKAVFHFGILRKETLNKPKNKCKEAIEKYRKDYIDTIPIKLKTKNIKLLSMFYFITTNFYVYEKKYAKANEFATRYIDLFEEENISTYVHEFTNALLFRIIILIELKKYKLCFKYLLTYKSALKTQITFNTTHSYSTFCTCSLQVLMSANENEKLKGFLKEYEKEYLNKTENINVHFYFDVDFYFAKAHFQLQNFKETSNYLDKIINFYSPITSKFNSLFLASKILYIMIFYEQQSFDTNEYYINNLLSALRRNELTIPFDLVFFNEFMKLNNKRDLVTKRDFESFKDKIISSENKNRLESYLDKTGFIYWLDLKIKHIKK